MGSSFGGLAHFLLMPLGISVTDPQAYALVGAAAMLAASCQVPLTAVLLLFELTRDYLIVVPTLGAVGLSYWLVSLPDLSLPTKLPFVGGPEDQLPLIWTGSTLQVRSFPELIGSLTLQPQQNQADSRSDVDRSPGSEVADAAPGLSSRPVRSAVQDTLEPVSFSVEVQRALGRAQRSAMLAAGGGALDREVDAVPQPTPLGTPHKAVLHKDSTSSQVGLTDCRPYNRVSMVPSARKKGPMDLRAGHSFMLAASRSCCCASPHQSALHCQRAITILHCRANARRRHVDITSHSSCTVGLQQLLWLQCQPWQYSRSVIR